jgi:gag-polypeptide of LTR copia-type
MVNYFNILDLWDIFQYCYVPHYYSNNLALISKAKELKSQNNYTVNIILNSVSEIIAILFGTIKIASEIREILLNRFEGNSQIKRSKLVVLESEFENFCIQEEDPIENMYLKLMHILNEFDNLGESLSNSKMVDKIFRVMMRRQKWESIINILEAMEGTLNEFTPKLKATALQAQRSSLHHHSSTIKLIFHGRGTSHQDVWKNAQLEKVYNKKCDEEGMTHIFFACHKFFACKPL